MEESSGSQFQIKLSIKEGRNFHKINHPTIIVASLNNDSLETDLIQPDNNPHYLAELIWKTEKKMLRIMRSGQTPLKVECFALSDNSNKERIGYVLLSIRSAQIISKKDSIDINFHWHELSGLSKDLKRDKPELLLSLVIEDVPDNTQSNKLEYECEKVITDTDRSHQRLVDIVMNSEDQDHYYNEPNKISEDYLGPRILDESLVYKIVDELETWKEKQKEMFRIKLQNKEEYYLNLLGDEWQKKKEALESKLNSSIEQCKILANSLNNATEDLRIRRLKSHEKETRLMKINKDMEKNYEMKLRNLELSFDKMQNQLSTKLAILEDTKLSCQSQIKKLVNENEKLSDIIKNLNHRLGEYEKESYREQTTLLLDEVKNYKEKLAKAEETCYYYKEQWNAIYNEMQRDKFECQQLLKRQAKNNKEANKKIQYENILSANSEALISDRMCLDQVQKKLELMGPRSARIATDTEHLNNHCHKFEIRDEEREAKIYMLTEQKKSFLKTGNYSNNDPIITKLDREINLLLNQL